MGLSKLNMEQGKYDACLFTRLAGDLKAGDTQTTSSCQGQKVRWSNSWKTSTRSYNYETWCASTRPGTSWGVFQGMRVHKVVGGFALIGKDSLADDILVDLGQANTKTSTIPKWQTL